MVRSLEALQVSVPRATPNSSRLHKASLSTPFNLLLLVADPLGNAAGATGSHHDAISAVSGGSRRSRSPTARDKARDRHSRWDLGGPPGHGDFSCRARRMISAGEQDREQQHSEPSSPNFYCTSGGCSRGNPLGKALRSGPPPTAETQSLDLAVHHSNTQARLYLQDTRAPLHAHDQGGGDDQGQPDAGGTYPRRLHGNRV